MKSANPIKYLTYKSVQTKVIPNEVFLKMLKAWRLNNQSRKITGVLFNIDGLFVQYIEGPAKNIDVLFKQIKNDQRHHDVIELSSGFTEERFFSDWKMAYKQFSKKELVTESGIQELDLEKLFPEDEFGFSNPALAQVKNLIGYLI